VIRLGEPNVCGTYAAPSTGDWNKRVGRLGHELRLDLRLSIKFPKPSFTEASVPKMCAPTLKSVAPVRALYAPSKLRAIRQKSAAVTGTSRRF
jgi:hypothetical protein